MNSEMSFDKKWSASEDSQDYKIISLNFVVEIIDNGIGIKQENISKLQYYHAPYFLKGIL